MQLRKKLLIFTALMTLVGLLLGFIGLNRILLHRFAELDESALRADINNILYSLTDEMRIIKTSMENYSAWDDTYRFVQRSSGLKNIDEDEYIKNAYPDATFSINKIHMAALINREGHVVYGKQFQPATKRLVPLHTDFLNLFASNRAALLKFSGPHDSKLGVVLLGGVPVMIVSLPVVTSNLEGPIQGTLIVGRMLDQVEINRLNERSQSEIHVWNYAELKKQTRINDDIWFQKESRNQAQVFAVVDDIFGYPSIVISTMKHRAVYESGSKSVFTFAIILFISIIATAGLGIAFINRYILSRITALAENIHNIGKKKDFSLRIRGSGNDEFIALEHEFNRMMSSLEEAQATLRARTVIDPLTQLYNRSYFYEKLNASIVEADSGIRKIAVLFIDLDHFKSVNDKWGHDFGDGLLQETAKRIVSCVHPSDIVSRLGGDEFTVLLSHCETDEQFGELADRIHRSLASVYSIQGQLISITASIGMSLYSHNGARSETLVTHADIAMFQAKKMGRNAMVAFSDLLLDNLKRVTVLEKQLLSAVALNEFEIVYQPILTCATHEPVKLEALIRWRNPIYGLVPPSEFIPLAESTGAIADIGAWVIDRVCSDLRMFHDEGMRLKIAVNISVVQLEQRDLLLDLTQALHAFRIDPEWLELEITESSLMSSEDAVLILRRLREQGFKVSLDDFGTGYSSLSYLRRFPVDCIKIDRSFIAEMAHHSSDKTLVNAIIDLGHNLGLTVVAEGVEDDKQLAILTELGCDLVQGYYFSKPKNKKDLSQFLHRRER
ncbi:bifunctional diguanylate cyclase/phosphodiesterase [Paenibacillus silvisoli]|uniref:bifunctional diguanylate cyclase/phosphodiesterase n=1 Tax=Paenibacillus silvisoli TaxID=3110539 RepID=UPI002803FC7E|nr:EAL domain-containing protein [Paenibacillus silvisoli]